MQALEEIGESWDLVWWRRLRFRRVWGLLVAFVVANMSIGYKQNLVMSRSLPVTPRLAIRAVSTKIPNVPQVIRISVPLCFLWVQHFKIGEIAPLPTLVTPLT